MKLKNKIIAAIIVVLISSIIAYFFEEPWVFALYNLVLALFAGEIKNKFSAFTNNKQIRVSYSYIFRIEIQGKYLLVKDEQGRNNYHPVGGVYKYYPDDIDVSELFNGEYDGLFNATKDTEDDLRLKIRKSKLKSFNKWFFTEKNRENSDNLGREFNEELIDRNILDEKIFSEIKYKYVGSYRKKSFNKELKLNQIRHYDIFTIKPTNAQRTFLQKLMKNNSEDYIFATQENIINGVVHSACNKYEIAEYTKLILNIKTNELTKEYSDIERTIKLVASKTTP